MNKLYYKYHWAKFQRQLIEKQIKNTVWAWISICCLILLLEMLLAGFLIS